MTSGYIKHFFNTAGTGTWTTRAVAATIHRLRSHVKFCVRNCTALSEQSVLYIVAALLALVQEQRNALWELPELSTVGSTNISTLTRMLFQIGKKWLIRLAARNPNSTTLDRSNHIKYLSNPRNTLSFSPVLLLLTLPRLR